MSFDSGTFDILALGFIISISVIFKSVLKKVSIPSVLVFLGVGFILKVTHMYVPFLSEHLTSKIHFLGKMGVVVLLFDVGLKSDLKSLIHHLREATPIWLVGTLFAGLIGFAASFWLLKYEMIPSLFLATAFTATSVGITTAIWREKGVLKKPMGQLLVDVAELDDLSGVMLMGLLFSITPSILDGSLHTPSAIAGQLTMTSGWFFLKFLLFIVFCYSFSKFMRSFLSHFMTFHTNSIERTLIVFGISFVIAAIAGGLGLSLAIGAFFAGIVFANDEETVRNEYYFDEIREFMTPFFFIAISIQIEPELLKDGLYIGAIILFFAFVSKVVPTGLVSWLSMPASNSLLFGVSMVPRAEIALIIFEQGKQLGDSVVPDTLYTGMIIGVMGTTLLAPLFVYKLIDVVFPSQAD